MRTILYGYELKDGLAVIHQKEAEQVKQLFYLISEGMSMRATAKLIGIERTHTTIARMLKNIKYVGDDFYPQIIEESLFHKVQEVREKSIIAKNRTRKVEIKEEAIDDGFRFKKAYEKKYDDPFRQATYVYSLITKEAITNG